MVAARTPGFVGADLANVVNEAALLAARRERTEVTMQDFDDAIDRITAGLEKKTRVMSKREKEIVAYHESGHALVASTLPHMDPVRKISIIPRGIAALGYTQQLPTEDRYLMTRSELEDRMCVLLGGRVAEELAFGDVSTGAQDDLQKATDIALSMVTRYGMSETLGLRTFESERRSAFLDTPMAPSKDYSEEKASAIDAEVEKILERSHDKVRGIAERAARDPRSDRPPLAREGSHGRRRAARPARQPRAAAARRCLRPAATVLAVICSSFSRLQAASRPTGRQWPIGLGTPQRPNGERAMERTPAAGPSVFEKTLVEEGARPGMVSGEMRRMKLLLVLPLAMWLVGCEDSMMGTQLQSCTTLGQQCDLGNGVLGVCFDVRCPQGQSAPCFTCAKQH